MDNVIDENDVTIVSKGVMEVTKGKKHVDVPK